MPSAVLLVEDDRTAAEAFRQQFETFSGLYDLHIVHSGRAARAYLSGSGRYQNRTAFPMPKTILLDLNMPGMDGFSVLEWIRKQPELKEVLIAVLTEPTEIRLVTKAYEMGAKTFLMKPAPIEELRDLLQALAA